MRKKIEIEVVYAAALRAFARYGYKKTTIEDIAGSLGMTKGNLYRYAKNKKDLYRETVSWALLQWQQRVAVAMEQEPDIRKKFETMCFKAVEYLSLDTDLRKILIHDPDIFPMFPEKDPFEQINRNSIRIMQSVLKQGIAEKAFREVDVEKVSEVIFMIYKMFIIRTYIKRESDFLRQVFAETIGLVTHGLYR